MVPPGTAGPRPGSPPIEVTSMSGEIIVIECSEFSSMSVGYYAVMVVGGMGKVPPPVTGTGPMQLGDISTGGRVRLETGVGGGDPALGRVCTSTSGSGTSSATLTRLAVPLLTVMVVYYSIGSITDVTTSDTAKSLVGTVLSTA